MVTHCKFLNGRYNIIPRTFLVAGYKNNSISFRLECSKDKIVVWATFRTTELKFI